MGDFSNNLRLLLDQRGWNQKEAAEQFGVSQQNVSRWINDAHEPSAAQIIRIATALRVSLDELLLPARNAVHEDAAPYRAGQSFARWFLQLRTTWQRDPRTHARIELGLRAVWPKDADEILAWLEEP